MNKKDLVYVCIPTTKERRPRLAKTIESVRANAFPHAILVYENQDGGCVAAMDNMLRAVDGLIFILNDDMTIGPKCLETLHKAYSEAFPAHDGIVQPFDKINRGRVAVSVFGHSKTIKENIFLGYRHKYWDREIVEVLKPLGKYLYVPSAEMDHDHEMDPEKYDETYKIMQNSHDGDRATYFERKAKRIEGM